MYREMTENEIQLFLLAHDRWHAWKINTDYAKAVYGPQAATIEIFLREEFDEDGPFNVVNDVVVRDRAGGMLYLDTGGSYFTDEDRATVWSIADPIAQVDYIADLLESAWSEALDYDRHADEGHSMVYDVHNEPPRMFTRIYVRVDEFTGKELYPC